MTANDKNKKRSGQISDPVWLYPFGETNCWQWRAASFYTRAFRVPFLHFLSAPNRQGTTRALDFAQYAECGKDTGTQAHRDTGRGAAQGGNEHWAPSTEQPLTAQRT